MSAKKKNGESGSTLKRILNFTKPHIHCLILSAVFSVVNVALTLYIPILIGDAVDCCIAAGKVDFEALLPILIKLAGAAAVGALSNWLMNLCTNKITYLTVRDIRRTAFEKLQRVPLSYIDSHPHGDLISRMITDTDQISDGLLMGFTQLFTGVVTILGTLGFMLSINPWITLVVVLITPLSFFVASFVAKHSFDMFQKQSSARGQMTSLVEEMIGGQHLVKAFSHEDEAEEEFDIINKQLQKYSVKAIFFSSLTNPSTRFVNGLIYAGVGVFGALTALSGGMSVGQLSCFLTYANQYTKPFNEISGVITELQSALACAKRVFEVIDDPFLGRGSSGLSLSRFSKSMPNRGSTKSTTAAATAATSTRATGIRSSFFLPPFFFFPVASSFSTLAAFAFFGFFKTDHSIMFPDTG